MIEGDGMSISRDISGDSVDANVGDTSIYKIPKTLSLWSSPPPDMTDRRAPNRDQNGEAKFGSAWNSHTQIFMGSSKPNRSTPARREPCGFQKGGLQGGELNNGSSGEFGFCWNPADSVSNATPDIVVALTAGARQNLKTHTRFQGYTLGFLSY